MQWLADVLVATMAVAHDWIAASWLSLLLLAIAIPFARHRVRSLPARRPSVAYGVIAAVALVAAVTQTVVIGEPQPQWYTDDFGNALTADMFAHGHLSYPTHPMHSYFETLYITQTPRYASMYPPGQALLLAAAQRWIGLRVAGVWLASVAAAVSICWAVAAVASMEIAFLAGLLCAIHPTMMEWNGYVHVGALAAAAGALAIGGALRHHSYGAAIAMGAGIAILANTRPFEGLVVASIACAFALRRPRRLALALAVALVGLAFTAWYNRAVTGNPLLLPYSAYSARYLSTPAFLWQKPLPLRTYPTFEMETRDRIFRGYYERSRHLDDFFRGSRRRIKEMIATALPSSPRAWWINTLRLFAALPLLFAIRSNGRLLAAVAVFVAAIVVITGWPQSHYLAPAAALFAILYALGLQRMIDRGESLLAYACVAVAFVIAGAVYVDSLRSHVKAPEPRAFVSRILQGRPGGQLVIADRDCFDTVFNNAEVDSARIVWAHHGNGDLQPLLAYYPDRRVWELSCSGPFRLQPMRSALTAGRSDYERDIFSPYHFPGR